MFCSYICILNVFYRCYSWHASMYVVTEKLGKKVLVVRKNLKVLLEDFFETIDMFSL
jgi:hypothetical protein